MGHVLGNFADNAVDLTGINGTKALAAAATDADPLHIIPSDYRGIVQNVAPLALNLIPGVGTAAYAAYNAAHAYGQGDSLGSSLGQGALSYGLGELGGAAANAFPETAGSIGLSTGGNSLTDLLGSTSNAGSLSNYYGDANSLLNSASSGLSSAPSSLSLDANGLQSGTGLAAGTSNSPLYNIGGGGASSYGTSGDVSNQFAQGLSSASGYTPSSGLGSSAPVGLAGLGSAPAAASSGPSLSGVLKYALPALGAASGIASNQAAQQQLTKSTNAANAQLSPYLQTGGAASGAVGNYLGLPGSTGTGSASDILAASPGYQFQLDQGNRALNAHAAATGSLDSGAALKAAQQFGQGLANQTGQQYLSNLQNTADQGLGAAGQYGNNTTALGTAKGAADIATGNSLSQLLSGVGGKRVLGYGSNNQPIYG